jgi:hypothetical protein
MKAAPKRWKPAEASEAMARFLADQASGDGR